MASRFWVGGTGTWDASDTTHWASSSGGAGGQSVPGSSDTVTFDASSGGGTVTLNFGGTITIQSLTMGAFTGTWDNSANNNNITVTASANALSISGSGTRTINLGSATYTLSNADGDFNSATTTNLTYSGSSATIQWTGGTGPRSLFGGSVSHGHIIFGANSGNGSYTITGSPTFASLSVTAPNFIVFPNGTTTISSAFTWTGSSSGQIGITSSTTGNDAVLACAGGSTATWLAARDITFTGSPTITNSFDIGGNSGATISPPGGRSILVNNPSLVAA